MTKTLTKILDDYMPWGAVAISTAWMVWALLDGTREVGLAALCVVGWLTVIQQQHSKDKTSIADME